MNSPASTPPRAALHPVGAELVIHGADLRHCWTEV